MPRKIHLTVALHFGQVAVLLQYALISAAWRKQEVILKHIAFRLKRRPYLTHFGLPSMPRGVIRIYTVLR